MYEFNDFFQLRLKAPKNQKMYFFFVISIPNNNIIINPEFYLQMPLIG